MSSNQSRPTYTNSQITQYFQRLKLPSELHRYDVAELTPEETLSYLALLQKRHLAAIPFENLTLHYSSHRQISIHPEELFRKIIGDDNGRGGYCMENNCLFGTLLYSLGFRLFSGGARVFDGGQWTGWGHMINLVTVGDMKYHVDVGFGGNGPVVPMPLDRSGPVQTHIKPATAHLQWQNIRGNTDPNQRLWVYQHRIDDDSNFETMYCFTELEFLPSDYGVMNAFTSTSPRVFFTRVIVVEKKLIDDGGELTGNLTMGQSDLKWRIHGKKDRVIQFEKEDDRIIALEEHFGIKLGQVERDSIWGLPSQIK